MTEESPFLRTVKRLIPGTTDPITVADEVQLADSLMHYNATRWRGGRTVPGKLPRRTYRIKFAQDSYGGKHEHRVDTAVDDAHVVSSEVLGTRLHAPVLDIDVSHVCIASSTPEHAHLYFDVPMTWRTLKRLLKAMEAAGILEPGFVGASLKRKHTAVRLPWVRKT